MEDNFSYVYKKKKISKNIQMYLNLFIYLFFILIVHVFNRSLKYIINT